VQTEDFVGFEQMFSGDYAYFSSFSSSWLQHAKVYVESMIERFSLSDSSVVVEVAANDGYLLQYVQQKKIPCYGIEPTASTAQAAREKGVEIIEQFFGEESAGRLAKQEGRKADLIAANNVLAHVPDINNFTKGFALLLKPNGVATFEFPHLLNLVDQNQFDTIYHEHFSYLSLSAVELIFQDNGLDIFDVEELATHGGSLRVYAQRADVAPYERSESVTALLSKERERGVESNSFYADFQSRSEKIKFDFLSFLISAKSEGKKVVGYGAAAKGNTLLNFSGVRGDLLPYVVDRNPAKQGGFMPGSRLPILDEERLRQDKPDYVLILPWNLQHEIADQLQYIREWGGQFVIAIPVLQIVP